MLQANPNLSPFDIRNIMQETATYRQCHYMGANEPCVDDLIPKNRQNNVYGHGHVNALESVIEAAEYNQQYTIDTNITLNATNSKNNNGSIMLGPGSEIEIDISQGLDSVQWMSNDLRDSWSNIHSYNHEKQVTLTYDEIVHELEHLPGIEIHSTHTLSLRGIDGTSSSPLISVQVELTEEVLVDVKSDSEESFNYIVWGSVISAIILIIVFAVLMAKGESEKEVMKQSDSDIDEVVEAELV